MKRSLAILALTLALTPLVAQSASKSQQAYGLPLLGQRVEDGNTFLVLQDTPKTEILLCTQAEPDAKRVKAILALVASLRSWQAAAVSQIRIVNYDDRFQLLALLSRFVVNGENQAVNLPGGIQFYYDQGGYDYDFRIKAGGLFVRAKGLYSALDDIVLVATRIIKDPAGFVLASDPLYSIRHFGELEDRVATLEGQNTQLRADLGKLTSQYIDLSSKTAADTAALAAKTSSDIASLAAKSQADTAAVAAKAQADTNALATKAQADTSALAAKMVAAEGAIGTKISEEALRLSNESKDSIALLNYALMTTINGGKPVNPDVIKKIVDWRAADPQIAKDKIVAKFKELKINASAKEIDAVLLVLYGGK